MDLKTFEKVHNKQIAFCVPAFVLYIGVIYFTSPAHLRSDFLNQNDPMFALIIGALIWMFGVKLTILGLKKGLIK